jgi:hypothetical protein
MDQWEFDLSVHSSARDQFLRRNLERSRCSPGECRRALLWAERVAETIEGPSRAVLDGRIVRERLLGADRLCEDGRKHLDRFHGTPHDGPDLGDQGGQRFLTHARSRPSLRRALAQLT